jgi:hypothetical protein
MRETAKRLARTMVRRSSRLGSALDRLTLRYVASYPKLYPGRFRNWIALDRIFTACRRQLYKDEDWRYGPLRVRAVAREVFDALAGHTSLENKVYCDLGCGAEHPFGTSTVCYVNGASQAVAMDVNGTDPARAAEALYDLLTDCLASPQRWHWSTISPDQYLERIRAFNLQALRGGDLEAGLAQTPLRHIVSDITNAALAEGSLDLMSSRAVLEHFLDFGQAVHRMLSLLAPGGFAYHNIDLVDHRAYANPGKYHWWSFLAEDESWSDGLCNRLRSSEIRAQFESAGFEVLRYDCRRAQMPPGFRAQIKGRFAQMCDDDLATIGVDCVIRRPPR